MDLTISLPQGTLSLTRAIALPASTQAPTIHGDHRHDDTAGLQALIDGKPFRIGGADEWVMWAGADGHATVKEGTFVLSATLRMARTSFLLPPRFCFRSSIFEWSCDVPAYIEMTGGADFLPERLCLSFPNCYFEAPNLEWASVSPGYHLHMPAAQG